MATTVEAPPEGLTGGMRKAILALGVVAIIQNVDPAANSIAVVPASKTLEMSASEYSLAASFGTLFLAATILAGGAVGDRLGRRKVMIMGALTAGVGAVISALAPFSALFLLGRAITGVGVGFCFGLSFALIRSVAPKAITQGVALWITVQMAGTLVLSLIAGAVVSWNWRFGYLMIAAIAGLAFLLVSASRKEIPDPVAEHVGKFDGVGLVSIGLGLVSLIYGISQIATEGIGSQAVLLPLMAAIALIGFFFWWEGRVEDPALPIGVFKDREMGAGVASIFSFNIWQSVLALQMVMFLTYLAQYDSFAVSLAQLPMMFVMVLGALVTGKLLAKGMSQSQVIITGHLLMIASTAYMFLTSENAAFLFFLAPQLIGGMGRIMTETAVAPWFVTKPPPDLTGAVGSSKTAIGQTAFGLGSALSATILYVAFGRRLQEAFAAADVPPEQQGIYTGMINQYMNQGAADGDPGIVEQVVQGARDLYVGAFHDVFTALLFIQAFLFVITFLLLQKNRKQKAAEAAESGAEA